MWSLQGCHAARLSRIAPSPRRGWHPAPPRSRGRAAGEQNRLPRCLTPPVLLLLLPPSPQRLPRENCSGIS